MLVSERPERRVYDFRDVRSLDEVSPDLKRDILGVRDKVLFVEGEVNSLDGPLYSACYPGWKVAPRGGHEKVQEAVKALNDNGDLHWMQVVGIVDGDGRDEEEVARLRTQKVTTLPVPRVENLFFLPEVVEQMASILSLAHGDDAAALFSAADSSLEQVLASDRDEIIARRATWLFNRKISEHKTSVAAIRDGVAGEVNLDPAAVKEQVSLEIDGILNSANLESLKQLPIKNTGIPAKITSALGLKLKKYKQTVLHQLEINSSAGKKMREAIMQHLPVLP